MIQPKTALRLSKPRVYAPVLPLLERQAYAAAHRILQIVEWGEQELVCPGGVRSRRVDRIAQAIMEEMGQ